MRIIKAGATSQSVYVEVLDSTSTTGGRKTGLLFNSAGLTAYYVRNQASAAQITLATLANPNSAWSSGGFKEVDATNMPGIYRLDVPDAALAAGVPSVVITLKGATGMVQVSVDIQLTAVDLQDAVRGGMTALPNAAAEAAGGLYTRGTGAGQINQAANGQIDANVARWLNTAVTAATAGIPDTNVKNMNNVAATAITTVNANQGTTQPVNFTGTGASALAKADMVDVAGAAVNALVGGRMDSSVGAMAANVVTAAAVAADAATEIRSLASGTADSGSTTTMVDAARTEADTDYWVGQLIVFTSGNITGQARKIIAFDPATDTITFAPAVTQLVTTQTYEIWPEGDYLRPTVSGRTVDVSTGGEVGLDWGNIGSPTTAQNLSGTNIDVDQIVASVSGNVGGNVVGSVASVTNRVTANTDQIEGVDATNQIRDSLVTDATRFAGANIDVAISTRSTLTAAGVWDALLTGITTVGSIGKLIKDFLDAAISSRSTYAGGAVASVSGNVDGNVTGSVGSLAAQAKTDVKDQAVAALATDTYAEPGQGAPAATTTIAAKINYIFKFMRNKVTQTSTTFSVYDDAGTTVDQKAIVSDDGTVFTRGEIQSGP